MLNIKNNPNQILSFDQTKPRSKYYYEPTWDGSKKTRTRNKAAEQSKGKDSTEENEDTELKTSAQQSLTEIGNQLTLQTLPRSTKDSEVVEGNIEILAHGPSYLGPRTLLYIADSPRKSVVKVAQSADSPKQNRTKLLASIDQQT